MSGMQFGTGVAGGKACPSEGSRRRKRRLSRPRPAGERPRKARTGRHTTPGQRIDIPGIIHRNMGSRRWRHLEVAGAECKGKLQGRRSQGGPERRPPLASAPATNPSAAAGSVQPGRLFKLTFEFTVRHGGAAGVW